MYINFTKMHGLGNDFVVIDLITQSAKLSTAQLQRISHRQLGIGCDQILVLEPPMRAEADFYYRIFNANGQEVEQCGNGLRCAAQFFYSRGYTNQSTLIVDCLAGSSTCVIKKDYHVTVSMGIPNFKAKDIPIRSEQPGPVHTLQPKQISYDAFVVSLGNPHAIIHLPDLKSSSMDEIASMLNQKTVFPKGINLGFMEIVDRNRIHLHVYERGVGKTLACGSNACAAVVSGITLGHLDNHCEVLFPNGTLSVDWEGKDAPVYLTGPATTVFSGRLRL